MTRTRALAPVNLVLLALAASPLAIGAACSDETISDAGAGGSAATGGVATGGAGAGGGGSAVGGADGGTAGAGGGTAEICDNEVDDDDDELVDCADRDCALEAGCPPWCEAGPGARCYYVDYAVGDDANDGSFEQPFRTYLNLVSYYGTPGEQGSTAPPATAVELAPGDAIYLMDGSYGDTYNYQGETKAFFVRGRTGDAAHGYRLEAYPGEHPVIAPDAQAPGVGIAQSSYWRLRGLEIAAAWQRGLILSESDQVVVELLHVHDVDGVDNDNIAGIYLGGATNVLVTRSSLHDNYDRAAEDTGGAATENSSNFVAFGGGNVTVTESDVYNALGVADEKIGGCIKYKHMRTLEGGTFTVSRNRLENCRFFSVGTGSPDSTIERNLIIDSAPFALRNFGGPTALTNLRIRNNTVVRSPGLSLSPDDEGAWVPLSGIEFSGNVIVDDESSYNTDQAMVRIGSYGSDEQFAIATAAGVLDFADNCYFNPETALVFDLFGAESFGTTGALYDFAGWQALGNDQGSFDEDPAFDADFVATSSHCAGRGHAAAP
jgi:hypothetical protein